MPIPAHALLMAAAGASSGITDPDDISDLTLWLDAADTGTITAISGGVTAWTDKSPDGRNYSQAGASTLRPTTGATTKNGHNVLDFDGGDYLSRGSQWALAVQQASGFSLFAALKRSSGSDMDLMGEGRSTNGTPFARWTFAATTNAQTFDVRTDSNARATRTSTEDINDTSWHVVSWVAEPASGALDFVMRVDQVAGYTGTWLSGTFTLNTNTIGALQRTSVTNNFNGSIAEIVAYDRELTSGEIVLVENYLKAKWAI